MMKFTKVHNFINFYSLIIKEQFRNDANTARTALEILGQPYPCSNPPQYVLAELPNNANNPQATPPIVPAHHKRFPPLAIQPQLSNPPLNNPRIHRSRVVRLVHAMLRQNPLAFSSGLRTNSCLPDKDVQVFTHDMVLRGMHLGHYEEKSRNVCDWFGIHQPSYGRIGWCGQYICYTDLTVQIN
jgi:hypothetical protein